MKIFTKDEAVDVAHTAKSQTMEELLANYAAFHRMVEVTPKTHILDDPSYDGYKVVDNLVPYAYQVHSHQLMRGLHAAIGLATESGEVLDAYKKMMFGKQRPIRQDNIKEECGDLFFYLHLLLDAYGLSLKDIIAHNVEKLANRYIERFET